MEEERSGIIKAITTPLGFFALSLLIVEGFLGITLGVTKVENQWFYFIGMIIGAALFVLVVGIVSLLVWHKPRYIVFGGKDYLEDKRMESEANRIAPLQKSKKNTTEKINLYNYYDDEPTQEEIERSGNRWIDG